jgi:ZIP family zinc transporter
LLITNHIAENIEKKQNGKKLNMLLFSVTLHNIPEGMAVGVCFAGFLAGNAGIGLLEAMLLAIGIAIQNIPEGAVVALPIKGETGSSLKAFLFGTFSGAVEPIAAVLGLFLAMQIQAIMPWSLAFAAGCMIYVVAEEMIPEMKNESHDHFGVWSFIFGFVIMLILDSIQL